MICLLTSCSSTAVALRRFSMRRVRNGAGLRWTDSMEFPLPGISAVVQQWLQGLMYCPYQPAPRIHVSSVSVVSVVSHRAWYPSGFLNLSSLSVVSASETRDQLHILLHSLHIPCHPSNNRLSRGAAAVKGLLTSFSPNGSFLRLEIWMTVIDHPCRIDILTDLLALSQLRFMSTRTQNLA